MLVAAFAIGSGTPAQEKPPAAAPAAETKQKAAFVTKVGLYPTSKCVVSGEDLDADAVTFTAGGRTFMTCCEKCKAKIEKDPATWAKKLDEALIAGQAAHYPLTTCVVSGRKLDSMGEPVKLVLDGMLVELCCDKCTAKATANAAAMAQKVREAAFAAQQSAYPLKTCVVSGEPLGDKAVSAMFGPTLVRFCSEKCMATFEKQPREYVAKLHAAYEQHDGKPGDGKPGAKPDKAGGKKEGGKDDR
jgi:YHS domain-containing protein